MADLIERKAAIDAVEHITSSMSICVNYDECHGMKRMQRQSVIELANIPSAQPDKDALDDAYAHGYTAAESEFRKRMEKPERKKGKWIDGLKCSHCGQVDTTKPNFCPNCGSYNGGGNEI